MYSGNQPTAVRIVVISSPLLMHKNMVAAKAAYFVAVITGNLRVLKNIGQKEGRGQKTKAMITREPRDWNNTKTIARAWRG